MNNLPRREEERRLATLGIRRQAAELAAERPRTPDENNGDEVNYNRTDVPRGDLPFIGSFSKGLRHDAIGDPDPVSYGSLLRALQSRDPGDFRQILLGPGGKRLVNPQGGFAFDLEGPDPQEPSMPPAPRFDSEVEAHEMGELYWMALARDVHFADYASNPLIGRAVRSLNEEFPWFAGARPVPVPFPAPVTPRTVFRGVFPGEQTGPYVSQFLWKGNSDPRKAPDQGRSAQDGFIAYGSQVIDQRQQTVLPGTGSDFLTDHPTWLRAQNGEDFRGRDAFDFRCRRFIRNLRDGANYVHFDLVINAYYNAAWLLLSEPRGDQFGPPPAGNVPMRDREFPFDAGNPYDRPSPSSAKEAGFVTFGDVHVIEVLTEVIGQAGRAVWWQKWGVHRRLRPEEFGGRIDNALNNRRGYPIHTSILRSLSTGMLAPFFGNQGEQFRSFLLPQAYPEGAPLHPAYGAGHATISGACVTILKAFFDESRRIENPVIPDREGFELERYTGAGATEMTVGGELNKLAGNIALFRNAAGVHWRSDYTFSLLLGEAVAVALLQELSITFNEDDAFFQLTRFSGQTIRIADGEVTAVA